MITLNVVCNTSLEIHHLSNSKLVEDRVNVGSNHSSTRLRSFFGCDQKIYQNAGSLCRVPRGREDKYVSYQELHSGTVSDVFIYSDLKTFTSSALVVTFFLSFPNISRQHQGGSDHCFRLQPRFRCITSAT